MKHYSIGSSSLQLPIFAYEWQSQKTQVPTLFILGGVHGDEIEGVACARGLIQRVSEMSHLPLNLIIIPEANPDGVLLKTRGNGNGVDLNRNLPTKDWSSDWTNPRYKPGGSAGSEPESQALMQFLTEKKPQLIISLHSWHPVLNVNGDCLPEAHEISKFTGYKVDTEIGYPTPGCLGTYAGLERNIGTLTYEIERGLTIPLVLQNHIPGILSSMLITADRFKI